MLTPTEAERLILEKIAPFPTEKCALADAHGRVLRQPLCADRDLPPFDRVTMDGYALRHAEWAAGRRTFQIEGTQAAGMRPFKLGAAPGACIEIMTGAVLPEGADCVVPYEFTTKDQKTSGTHDVTLAEDAALRPGAAVHARGSDHGAGTQIVAAGARLSGREIAVAASCGFAQLQVVRQPKIVVIATGDELVDVETDVAPHQVRRSNDYALRAALIAAGFPRVERFLLHDMRHEIEHQLWHLLAEFDVVLLAGGVSKGKFDFLPDELDKLGVRKVFQGVAQRPGKPFWFGVSADGKPVFALPGNPVSAYTCLHRYVLPALAHASGQPPAVSRQVALAAAFTFKAPLACLLPVRLTSGPRGELLAAPDPSNTSGDFGGLVGTDGFVELPPGPREFPAGTVARFFAWA